MGEEQGILFSPEYNHSIRVEARPEKVTSDAGALVMREVMDRLSYSRLFARHLTDARAPERITHPQIELLRTVLLLLAQGWSKGGASSRTWGFCGRTPRFGRRFRGVCNLTNKRPHPESAEARSRFH